MKPINAKSYLKKLNTRQKDSRISKGFQLVGLEVADILGDKKRKSLYIKYAKEYPSHKILGLAKSIAARKNIKNPGAYFMRLMQGEAKKKNGR